MNLNLTDCGRTLGLAGRRARWTLLLTSTSPPHFSSSSLDTMSDDFVRLVSQANPASRQQYQPANTGYPPSSPPDGLDPFFDDDDDVPDSAFGRPSAMQSKESGLPFARSGASPAGVGNSQLTLPTAIQPDQWSFDDDSGSKSFAGSSSFPGPSAGHQRKPSKSIRKKWKWKWPWQKEQVLTGNRVVALNNSDANADFCNNYVSTSKYNLVTFMPKFLFGASCLAVGSRSATELYMSRAILEVRELVLLVHRPHPADTRRVTHEPLYHHSPPWFCTTGIGIQRDAGGSGESPVLRPHPCAEDLGMAQVEACNLLSPALAVASMGLTQTIRTPHGLGSRVAVLGRQWPT